MAGSSDVDTSAANSLRITTINHPYACSITSSASSPSSSIFSIDAISSQSSAASSSTTSVNVVWGNDSENESSYFPNQRPETENPSVSSYISSNRKPDEKSEVESSEQPFCDAAGPESRQHPRRTHRLTEANAKNGATTSCLRPPPALVRQSERKDNFVDSLVGKQIYFA